MPLQIACRRCGTTSCRKPAEELPQHFLDATHAELGELYRFDLIILDDLSYVRKDQAETSVLFELIAERYERRGLLITANQPFSGWNDMFPDPSMTVAAINRLVHHSTIFELNVESYWRRSASDNKQARRRQLPEAEAEATTTMTT